MNSPVLAKKIKNIRLSLRLTQEQFAQKIGVSFSTVNGWERGKRKPSPLALKQIETLSKEINTKRK